jgi:glycosyltransferase involved in cell wall biosynthesis
MKVSVIIPCYNFEDYIEQAILSAISQKTNFEFEILVRDDMSTDNSQICIERVSNFNSNVIYFKAEENLGAGGNIKFLTDKAKGEYIAYLDGDDYWTDVYKLQKQVDFMDSNPDYVLNFTGYWTRKENEYSPSLPYQWLGLPNHFENDEIKIEDLIKGSWSSSFGRLFRNTPGLFKDWMMDVVYFDWITNYELSKLGKIKYLDFSSGVHRIHNNGALSGMELEKRENHSRDILRLILNDYEKFIKNNKIESW